MKTRDNANRNARGYHRKTGRASVPEDLYDISKSSLIADRDEYIKALKVEASHANEQLLHVKATLRETEEELARQVSDVERAEVGAKSPRDKLTIARAELDSQSQAYVLLVNQKKMLEAELNLRKVETNTLVL